MKQNKHSEIVELNEDELAGVSGGDGSNNGLLYGIGGAAVGAGAMAMLRKPKTIVQTVEHVHPATPASDEIKKEPGSQHSSPV